MASCDAADVQVKTFSPPFRRARETRKGGSNEGICQAEQEGGARCPDGYCACAERLRRKVVTPVHPWGAPESTPKKWKPLILTAEQMKAEALLADERRDALRDDLIPAVETLVQKARARSNDLGEDELERLIELEEWLALLKAEPKPAPKPK